MPRFTTENSRASGANGGRKSRRGPDVATIAGMIAEIQDLKIDPTDEVTELLKKYKVKPSKRTMRKAILIAQAEKAKNGDTPAFKALTEFEFGKAMQAVEHSGPGGGPQEYTHGLDQETLKSLKKLDAV